MADELVAPAPAIREFLGLKEPKRFPLLRNMNISAIVYGNQKWLNKKDVLRVLRAEYEATEHPVLYKLIRALDEGTQGKSGI